MGGNLQFIDSDDNARTSDDILVSHRDSQQDKLRKFFSLVDEDFVTTYNYPLFGKSLGTGSAYSGSTRAYMNKQISTSYLAGIKSSLGDIDVQIPWECRERLNELLIPGKVYDDFIIHYIRQHGNQTHAIIYQIDIDRYIQIDFCPVEYDSNGEPTEFDQFAHRSDLSDMEVGIKGYHHKYLLQSIFAAYSEPAIISTLRGRGKNKIEKFTDGVYVPYTLSVDRGLRQKWRKIGFMDGKPVIQEIPIEESEYTKSIPAIYFAMFNRHMESSDFYDLQSFRGLIGLIKDYIPERGHEMIIRRFSEKLWGKIAQSHPNKDTDKKEKDIAFGQLLANFPQYIQSVLTDTLNMREKYYKK